MEARDWDAAERELLHELRDRIWTYVTGASSPRNLLLQASALLQLPIEDVRELGTVHFLAGDEVRSMTEVLPQLIRHLSTTTLAQEELSFDRVRGPVLWGQTLALQAASGTGTAYVTSPAFRAYQTPENELLTFVLRAIVATRSSVSWARKAGWLAERLNQARDASMMALESRQLQSVIPRELSGRSLRRVTSGRRRVRYRPVSQAFHAYQRLVGRLDVDGVRAAIEQTALTTSQPERLFELACLFDVIDALRAPGTGWFVPPLRLFHGRLRLSAHRGDERLDLWFQSVPPALRHGSRYRSIQESHGFAYASSRIPDIILRLEKGGKDRWLLVEVKLRTAASVEDAARDALADLLSYREDFRVAMDESIPPYGLGIAWGREGADLLPGGDEVMLVTRAGIKEAVGVLTA